MFAVPGWSVSSSALKQQTEPASQAKNLSQPADETPRPDAKSKKRKRGNDNVTKGNVDEMYRRVIEGVSASTKAGKKQKKEGKAQSGNAQASPAQKGQAKDGAEKKPQSSDPSNNTPAPSGGNDEKKANKKQKKNKKNKDIKPQESTEPAAKKDDDDAAAAAAAPIPPPPLAKGVILTPLQQAMRQKLISSRFRHLNETLYTTDSKKALELFTTNPELFDEYHAGFSRQVKESWPSNPVDGYIQAIRTRGAINPPPKQRNNKQPDTSKGLALPRRPNRMCTVADLGCGDAALARALTPSAKKLNLKLLSYDLHAPDPLITKADISNLPIEDGSVDVAIFCLSLMGTNWVSFVEEAWRVLRSDGKGECWVSEVKSRFGKVTRKKSMIGAKKPLSKSEQKKLQKKKKKGGDDDDAGSDVDDADIYAEDARETDNNDETDVSAFVEVFRTRGFVLKPESVDKSNKMFVKMEFVKQGGAPTKGKHASAAGAGAGPGKKRFIDKAADAGNSMSPEEEAKVLKPCVYKIR